MVTHPIQQPSTVVAAARPPAARQHRPTLHGDVHALARALAGSREPHWRERLVVRLGPLGRAFADHVRVTEGPAGLYAELLHQAPRLDRGVRLLTREHADIAAAIVALQHVAEAPGVPVEELCGRAAQLLRALQRHRQRGADLLWEAYQADLGGET
ncbi:hypothetical protein GCM10023176_27540 [Micromonospora coerulea]|uniref:Hemerythrin HHE cation binding domain-containing protein n=1 Tax=Micromonospora coerulea TaxID=47856 RepID=A0ABP8SII1_9ACTN